MKFIFENQEIFSSVVPADAKTGRSRIPWNDQLHFIRGQYHCIHFHFAAC